MDKTYLLKEAKRLKAVSKKASEEYQSKADELVSKMNELMQNRPDIEELVGAKNLSMMKDNHSNHIRFISSIIQNYNAEVMVDTVLWVFNAYQNHGFKSNYWAAQLNTWMEIMKGVFTEETYKEVYPFYNWMQVNIPVFVKVSEEVKEAPKSLHH